MSRIGKRPIKLTQGVEVNFKERLLSVKGPKGELELRAHPAHPELSQISTRTPAISTSAVLADFKLLSTFAFCDH